MRAWALFLKEKNWMTGASFAVESVLYESQSS